MWVGAPPPGAAVCVAARRDATAATASPPPSPACLVGSAQPPASCPPLPPGWAAVGEGEAGEVFATSPGLASSYLRDPAASAAAFLTGADGQAVWLRTGDAGRVGRGAGGGGGGAAAGLWLLGRGAEAWRVGGETVHAAAVDAALAAVPGLDCALAVARPDERLGCVVGALVVVSEGVRWAGPGAAAAGGGGGGGGGRGVTLTPSAVVAACRSAGLPGFALPRVVVGIRGGLPTVAGSAKPCRRTATEVVGREGGEVGSRSRL